MTGRHGKASTPKILFLMHSDWNLVWQRPHALATTLHARHGYRLLVGYLPSWRRWKLIRNSSPIRRVLLPQLPFGRRVLTVDRLNRMLARATLKIIAAAWRPDAVLVPYPSMFDALPKRLRDVPIIYDCMDLAVGFHARPEKQTELQAQERELVAHAGLIFVSSQHLKDHIESLHPTASAAILVRNGFDAGFGDQVRLQTGHRPPNPMIKIGYFGMISSWFDQDAIRRCLETFDNLEFHLWGPNDVDLLRHRRLIIHGSIPHAQLPEATAEMDALIMPFAVSHLIEGVDPVKLYEYLSLGKPVITIYYPELDHFDGLVEFYRSHAELLTVVARVVDRDPSLQHDDGAVSHFLHESTWDVRAAVMASAIQELLGTPAANP